jgi:2-oxoisovalerate dehydrogenase E1 component
VVTPPDWIEASMSGRPHIAYFQANGLDLVEAYHVTAKAVEHCRRQRAPVFLHLKTIRMLGHAGSDAETEYHTLEEIAAIERDDPLLHTARLVIESGAMTPADVLAMYEDVRQRVNAAADRAAKTPKLCSAEEVMRPLAPYHPEQVNIEAARAAAHEERVRLFGGENKLPEKASPRHMAVLINQGLHDILLKYPEAVLFGEDVAKKGGVYHVTTGLTAKFGVGRVFNTLLDETTILGLGIGFAHMGFLPIPELQYLAYYHNAEDQIRGEACSLQYFSNAQYRNPMVVRIAGWAYQKGFGGHFHNDNSIAALRDIPGLIIASPARGDDAVKMMRTCLALAKVDGRVITFLEPIALYMTKDLYETGDNAWCFPYPPPGEAIALGEGQIYEPDAHDLTILSWSNGLYLSLRAARTLAREHGIRARVVDLRWLNPLNEEFIIEQAAATGRVLIVDEGRRTGGVSEALMSMLAERGKREWSVQRLSALDTYIPLAAAALKVLPSEDDVVSAARRLLAVQRHTRVMEPPRRHLRTAKTPRTPR